MDNSVWLRGKKNNRLHIREKKQRKKGGENTYFKNISLKKKKKKKMTWYFMKSYGSQQIFTFNQNFRYLFSFTDEFPRPT